jgi:hypothetical protein
MVDISVAALTVCEILAAALFDDHRWSITYLVKLPLRLWLCCGSRRCDIWFSNTYAIETLLLGFSRVSQLKGSKEVFV